MDLTYLCKELGVLPKAGGLLDQDPYHLRLLRAGLSAIHKKQELEIEQARRAK